MKTDWLLAVGCSLTWGSETTVVGSSLVKDHDNAWPAHLGKMLSTDTVINRGWPGRSNSSIFRVAASDMIHYANEFGSNGIIAIQWSGNARMEFINPYKIDIAEYYLRVNNGNHPGQEGPYLNITPNDLGVFPNNPSIIDDVCIRDYFLKYWAHEFYQQELLFTYSISLTSIATRLGIRIIQFNGIDELNPASLPSHAAPLNTLIGNEFYYPYDRFKTFWCSAHPDILKMRGPAGEVFKMPHHPTTAQHIEWATTLYDYIKTI